MCHYLICVIPISCFEFCLRRPCKKSCCRSFKEENADKHRAELMITYAEDVENIDLDLSE